MHKEVTYIKINVYACISVINTLICACVLLRVHADEEKDFVVSVSQSRIM